MSPSPTTPTIPTIPSITPETLQTPPPLQAHVLLHIPTPHILLIILNRPQSLNALPRAAHAELHSLFEWFDTESSLRVAVITGIGRAFCAGADLKEWERLVGGDRDGNGIENGDGKENATPFLPPSGFAGLTNRRGKKPVIGAINGLCLGAGFEIALNLDLVVACESAVFALPEVKRGVAAVAGGLPRLGRLVGRKRAMEVALVGGSLGSRVLEGWGVVNEVVEDEETREGAGDGDGDVGVERVLARPVVKKALEYAQAIAENSPDAVIVSREGVRMGCEDGRGVGESARELAGKRWWGQLQQGENMQEGLRAFVEKRNPSWVDSKL